MEQRRTLKEYQIIDLVLWGILVSVFEFVIIFAARFLFPNQPFTVSLAGAVTAIVFMRWGWWGGFHAALAGFIYCVFSGAGSAHYVIYCVGNLLSVAAVPLLLKVGKERVRESVYASVGFAALVLLLMQAGRALMALVLGTGAAGVTGFFTTDSLSYLFTIVIIWMARRLDGIYEDQKHYLLRINRKKE